MGWVCVARGRGDVRSGAVGDAVRFVKAPRRGSPPPSCNPQGHRYFPPARRRSSLAMRTASPRSSLLTPVLAHPFVAQHAEQHVVLPAAVDAQIFARIALFAETGLEQQAAARPVRRQARRLDPMQLRALEREAGPQAEARGHKTAPGKTPAGPNPGGA